MFYNLQNNKKKITNNIAKKDNNLKKVSSKGRGTPIVTTNTG